MADYESASDFPLLIASNDSISATGAQNAKKIAPRPMRIIKSYWINNNAQWDAAVNIRIEHAVKGALPDELVAAGAVLGQVFTVHHRESTANAFAAGDVIQLNVVDASATGVLHCLVICRPL